MTGEIERIAACPWTVVTTATGHRIENADGRKIAGVSLTGWMTINEAQAAANLISAAPEAVRALEMVLKAKALVDAGEFDGVPDFFEWEALATAVIAKSRAHLEQHHAKD